MKNGKHVSVTKNELFGKHEFLKKTPVLAVEIIIKK
jgi:hypothetical protein